MQSNENFSDVLARRLKHYGLDRAAIAAMVCAAADNVGKGKFQSISFRTGALKIRVGSEAQAHLLRLREKFYILKINEKLKKDLVKRLRFEIS